MLEGEIVSFRGKKRVKGIGDNHCAVALFCEPTARIVVSPEISIGVGRQAGTSPHAAPLVGGVAVYLDQHPPNATRGILGGW
jgi:hypothetical protein